MKGSSKPAHLDRLENLKDLVGAYYYQTVWYDFNSHEAIWELYVQDSNNAGVQLLIEQIEVLLHEHPDTILQFLEREIGAGGLYFANSEEAIEWLQRCKTYMQSLSNSP